MTFESNLD